MRILGLSYMYHDSAACLLDEGRIVAAAAEERFSRVKHSVEFPLRAIAYCLSEGGLTIRDLDAVVFYEKPYLKFERILKTHLAVFPRSYRSFRHFLPMWLNYKLCVPQIIREETGYEGPVYFTDHHYAHAASSFLLSPFEKAAILTMDGTGEWSTLAIGLGEGTRIKLERDIRFPHSLGLLYSAVTAHLGFKVNGGEGKVMGLAGHGKPRLREAFSKLLDVRGDGSFRLNLDYFSYHYGLMMTNRRFAEVFGPPREPEARLDERHADLAATLQAAVEDVICRLVRHAHATYGVDRLCLAGGVALNCVANGRILAETPIKELFVQPAAGDDGGALGSALYLHAQRGGKRPAPLEDACLGPAYPEAELADLLRARGIAFEELPDEALVERVSLLLAQGRIVGWFQGRMEFGPRALGNRSILADPRDPGMKDRLNCRVKRREPFRPFGPAVCEEDAASWFEVKGPSPYMLLSVPVREESRSRIPSAVHVDGSARLQTVSARHNEKLYRLLRAFGARTGVPVLINTSFNLRGEPIVCSPKDAVSCYLRSDLDALALGNCLTTRN